MKTRFVSAVLGLVLFAFIMLMPRYVFGIAFFVLSCIAINEYYRCLCKMGYNPYKYLIYLPSVFIPILILGFEFEANKSYVILFMMMFFILVTLLFLSYEIIRFKKYNFIDAVISIFTSVYIVPFFAALIAIRYLDFGFYNVFYAFIGAWITDTSAYFTGRFFGKHKLSEISPKKTVEGAIGGVIGTTIFITGYGVVLNNFIYDNKASIFIYIFMGIILGIFSQLGDLTASSIKRKAQIKDFGKLMPGHGGVLDRFDSLLFTAPIVLIFMVLFF